MSAAVLDLSTRRIKIYASAYDATARADIDEHAADLANPHAVTKAQVGLANADNTADAAKPVSTAQAAALALKAPLASPALTGVPTAPTAAFGTVSGQLATTQFVQAAVNALDIPDVTGDLAAHLADNDNPHAVTASDVGLGAVDNTADAAKPVSAAQQTAINVASAAAAAAQADIDGHQANTGNPHAVTKAQVGLGNVANLAAADLPVSTATQAALNTKAPLSAATDAAEALADATAAQAAADQAIADAAAAQTDATQALADAATAKAAADAAQADATAALEAIEGVGGTIIGAGGASHPGETPALYGQTKTGPAGAVVPVDPAWVATSAAGSVLRIDAATASDPQTIAPAAPVPLEAGRLYEIRWKVQRVVDPADPLNDSITLGIRWLAADKTGLPGDAGTTIVIDATLVVADGESGGGLRVAAAANPLADVVAPAAARYFRPFIDLYGDSHVTDVIVLGVDDVSAGIGGAPLILPLLDVDPAAAPGAGLMALYGLRNADGSATLRMQAGTDPAPMDIILNVGAGA